MMTPTSATLRQLELEERRLGMRSLDPVVIAYHFGRARRYREAASDAGGRLRLADATGTKGAHSPEPE